MSREVEVTGIKLTASTPESVQISLGSGTGMVVSGTTGNHGLAQISVDGSDSPLTAADAGKVMYYNIKAPDGAKDNTDTARAENTNTTDWYNTVDFSQHYVAGRLVPVSSTDGNYLFKTLDATKMGKDVANTASFATVTTADEAGLYCIGSLASDQYTVASKTYTLANAAGDSQDNETALKQGYYIDFPVWFRTSAKANSNTNINGTSGYVTNDELNLGVIATITQRTSSDASEDLYHAVRVAVLPTVASATADTMDNDGSTGVITNYDDYAVRTTTKRYYDRYSSDGTSTNNGAVGVKSVDMSTSPNTLDNQAVYQNGNLVWNPSENKVTNALELYGGVDYVIQAATKNSTSNNYDDGESVVKVPLATTGDYGYSARYVIRVWLEGEDINCWNETAGQDWNIALKFVELEDKGDNNTTAHPDNTDSKVAKAANSTSLVSSKNTTSGFPAATANADVTLKFNNGSTDIVTLTYKATGSPAKYTAAEESKTWKSDATYGVAIDKATWKLADGTAFGNEGDFVNYLNRYNGVYALDTLTLTSTDYVAPSP